jgi:ATP-dependent 26S proteasome regulatory subunit
MFIGDGAKLVRDAFELAKEKAPAIIFIDELDAIGTKRFDSEKSGDREVQRTMLELLNQLDGFSSDQRIKVITTRLSSLVAPTQLFVPRSLQRRTGLISLTPPFSVQVVWIVR